LLGKRLKQERLLSDSGAHISGQARMSGEAVMTRYSRLKLANYILPAEPSLVSTVGG
jgi:hypothetical protein